MSGQPLELCYELSYHDEIDGLPCRGPAKLLLDGLEAFAKEHQDLSGPNILTMHYLHLPPYGLRHSLLTTDVTGQDNVLVWDRVSDKMKITQLITQLFEFTIQSSANETQVIDLDNYQEYQTSFPQPSHGSPLTDLNASDDEFMMVLGQAGPMARLARRDPSIMPDLLNAGFKEPFPLIAKSQDKLVDLLTTWMAICPGKDPPGSVKLDRKNCGHKITYRNALAFTATSDYVWVERIPISKSHMGWMLKEEDGYCMLVLNNPANNVRWRGYHGWLGGDLGFTSITVADTGPEQRQTLDGQMNDGPKKGNSNSSKRASHESSSFSDLSDFDETEEDGEPMNEPCTNSHNGKSSKRPQPDVGTAETAPVMIKQEPKRTAVRQAAMRRNQIERQTDEQRWRFDTPPLSSMETVKNMRWPPQYVSPPRTPQRKNLRQTITPKRQNTSAAPDSQAFPHERSSSPEVVAAGPARTPPGTRRSSRVIKRSSYTFKTPLATLSKKSHAPKTPSPKTPSKDSHKKKASEPLTPISPASTSTAIEPSLSQSADTINVIVHFFLSDDSLGAVPIPLDQCNSVDRFFNQALRAWRFLGIPDSGDSMAGVRVMMEGVQWPIIVAWGEVDAFGWLIDAITKAKGGRTDDLHVQVIVLRSEQSAVDLYGGKVR